jgi:hypothetical protein
MLVSYRERLVVSQLGRNSTLKLTTQCNSCLEEAIQVMRTRWKPGKKQQKVQGLRALLDGGVLAEVFAREDMGALVQYTEDSEKKEETARQRRGNVQDHVDWAWRHFGRPKGKGNTGGAAAAQGKKNWKPRVSAGDDMMAIFNELKPPGATLHPRGMGDMVVMYNGEYVASVSLQLRLERKINPVKAALDEAWQAHCDKWSESMPEVVKAALEKPAKE